VSPAGGSIDVHGFGADPAGRLSARVARTALRFLRCRKLGVSFCSVVPAESARLNRLWRRRSRPAEILSFAAPADEPGGNLGEIYLCLPLIRRRARRLGLPYGRWVAELAGHGILHLMGFHHGDPEAERRMFTVQAAVVGVLPRGQARR